jgi:hydrogenase maturation protein HypF
VSTTIQERWIIKVNGIVQGVGFRPFVFNLAQRYSLKGFVRNQSDGVLIEIEGEKDSLQHVVQELKVSPPPLTKIDTVTVDKREIKGYTTFSIEVSDGEKEKKTLISPDIATCKDCLEEIMDEGNRRYRYPFTNCTNCGPRFTIVKDVPYDRKNTTMVDYEMCSECKKEYGDPVNRRFHAQPNCCSVCGPSYYLRDSQGKKIEEDVINRAASVLDESRIVAVKGLGGYHLACNGCNEEVVRRLRARKYREGKPFALMARSIEQIREYCVVTKEEEDLLLSPRRPIVLLKRKSDSRIADSVAPRQKYLGFMLPYTPLQTILLSLVEYPLVMTSGNVSDEPICYEDEKAFDRLKDIADFFLTGTREIYSRCDDSVTRVFNEREYILRRSRGYAPEPIFLPFTAKGEILAVGPYMKNTFCFLKGNRAFLSHHIGDLENIESFDGFRSEIEHYRKLFQLKPTVVAYDLHPDYLSTKFAQTLEGVESIGIQHHSAHIAACCGDNSYDGEVIGVAFDGTGYGLDSTIWGGEFLVGSLRSGFSRKAHLKYIPLPGGDSAVREPWKIGLSYLYSVFGDQVMRMRYFKERERSLVLKMIKTGYNSIMTSSMGRLFDAVSAIAGVRESVQYDAQAAVELEMEADEKEERAYIFEIMDKEDLLIVDSQPVIREVVRDFEEGEGVAKISARFHNGVASMVTTVSKELRDVTRIDAVALSGGVFQNMYFLQKTSDMLKRSGFRVLVHSRVPPNDGGISFGQVLLAAHRNV